MKFSSVLFGSAVLATTALAAPRPAEGREGFAKRHHQNLVDRKAAIQGRTPWGSNLPSGHQSHAAQFVSNAASTTSDTEEQTAAGATNEFGSGATSQSGEYATIYTSNWAGAVQESAPDGEQYNYVSGTWIIPTVTRPSGESGSAWYVAEWIGIDGYSYQDAILQAGILTEVTYDDSGNVNSTAVSAWYEWYPDPLQYFEFDDFETGDAVMVSVEAQTTTQGIIVVQNLSRGMQVSIGVEAPSSANALGGQNAEWIVEDISEGNLVPFGEFSGVVFNNCVANTSSLQVGLSGASIIDMQQDNTILATSVLNGDSTLQVTYGS